MTILYTFLLMNLCWIYFLAIMHLREARDAGRLTGFAKALGYFNLFIGLLLDTLVNFFVMTLLFLEFPKEFLTTARLCRWYETEPTSWRGRLATWFGVILLNPFDPSGKHVK